MQASVAQCVDLIYSSGETSEATGADRPPHLRAASSLQWLTDERIIVLQDDTAFIGLLDIEMDPHPQPPFVTVKQAFSVQLPAGPAGVRQFQHSRGNKGIKLDLEASVLIPSHLSTIKDKGAYLLAFGSGSKQPFRDVIILLKESVITAQSDVFEKYQPAPAKYWHEYEGLSEGETSAFTSNTSNIVAFSVPELYDMLRSTHQFSGSELNIEGALLVPGETPAQTVLRFFQRGNGAPDPVSGLQPISATADLPLTDVTAILNRVLVKDEQPPLFEASNGAEGVLRDVVQYDLGIIEPSNVALTFTGAAQVPSPSGEHTNEEFVYIAGAEDSPDVTRDGEVVGVALGIVDALEREGRYALVQTADGKPFFGKAEGA
jgi:hypothetical protein